MEKVKLYCEKNIKMIEFCYSTDRSTISTEKPAKCKYDKNLSVQT